jgi:two-component system CheB/CheR fusion protein
MGTLKKDSEGKGGEAVSYKRQFEKKQRDSERELQELIVELQTYRIELEMQNEELRFAQQDIERSRHKYESLFRLAPIGFFTLDKNGVIKEHNLKGAELIGLKKEEITQRRLQQFIKPEYLASFYNFFKFSKNELAKAVTELQFLRSGTYVQLEGVFTLDEKGKPVCHLAVVDISLRKLAEEEQANQKLKLQKEQLDIILHAQDEERGRIAESLHNGLGQLLYAAKLRLEDLDIQRANNLTVKKQVELYLDEAIEQARSISFDLGPSLLKDFGLKAIVKEMSKRLSTKTFILTVDVIGLQNRLPETIETLAYRICQEMVNNVMKHAHASEAHLQVIKQKQKLILRVEDNGVGFKEKDAFKVSGGIGLKSIANRIKLIKGEMAIESSRSKGTIISVRIPV